VTEPAASPPAPVIELRRAAQLLWTIVRLGTAPALRRLLRLPPSGPGVATRVRLGLEQLGFTYLKLGQYLAMRFDILPPEVCRELGRLFENVPPMPFPAARGVLEEELGRPLEELFAEFEPEPIAAASVGQVHSARTWAGEHVAVKVQRVGIEPIFHADVRNLRRVTALVDALHLLGRMSACEMLDEFARWTFQETDFRLEARTGSRVREMAGDGEVVPAVHWDLTTRRVLTLEFIEGMSLAQIVHIVEEGGPEALAAIRPDLDVEEILHNLVFALLRQIFVNGLFHGDPHPGNILVPPDNRVAFIDFGIFGAFSAHDREIMAGQLENLSIGSIDESLRAYVKQLEPTAESDQRAFRREARRTLAEWYGLSLRPDAPIGQRHVGKYIGEMIDISRRHYLMYDMSYLLYWRTINALHSTCLRLSPGFELVADLRRFFEMIRPGPVRRVANAFGDRRAWAAAGAVARRAQTAGLPRSRAWSPGRVVAGETAAGHRTRSRRARRLAAGTLGVSLAVLLGHLAAHGTHLG
jgi:ubiquinone biosynthesis protein